MASLGAKINSITGINEDDIQSHWLSDSAKEIISILPLDRAAATATNITIPSSTASFIELSPGLNSVTFSVLPSGPYNETSFMFSGIEPLITSFTAPDGMISIQTSPGDWNPPLAFEVTGSPYEILVNSPEVIAWNLDNGAEFQDGSPGNFINIDFYRVLNVTRNDGSHFLPCRRINSTDKGKASLESGYVEEATKTDPVYYYENNKLVILPTPITGEEANIDAIEYPSISPLDTGFGSFPDEYEILIVLGAAIKAKMHQWSMANNEEDFELGAMHSNQMNALKQEFQTKLQILTSGISQQAAEKGGSE